MAYYKIQDTTLTAIADAVREKTGETGAMSPTDMAGKIESISGGGGDLPNAEEASFGYYGLEEGVSPSGSYIQSGGTGSVDELGYFIEPIEPVAIYAIKPYAGKSVTIWSPDGEVITKTPYVGEAYSGNGGEQGYYYLEQPINMNVGEKYAMTFFTASGYSYSESRKENSKLNITGAALRETDECPYEVSTNNSYYFNFLIGPIGNDSIAEFDEYKVQSETINDLADAIRERTGSHKSLTLEEMTESVNALSLQEKSIMPSTEEQKITPDYGYYGLSKVNVKAISLQEKIVSPTTSPQEIIPDDDYHGLAKVTVLPSEGGESAVDHSMEDGLIDGTGTVYINNRITNIRASAFYRASLTYAGFSQVITVGDSAFYNCNGLTSVSFPACTSIGYSAFAYCSSLTTANFPVCTSINSYAFQGCSSLTTVSFPVCTSIGWYAFQSCSSLTSANFPVCETILAGAFRSCYSLTSVSFPVCTSIENSAFYNCNGLISVDFPACVTVSSGAFAYCYSLASISLSVCKNIGSSAFMYCNKLTEINLPNAEYIYASAFTSCTRLRTLILSSIKGIYSYAFSKCYNLSRIILYGSSPCYVQYNTMTFGSTPFTGYSASFSGTPYIYVPASLVDIYKSNSYWSYFASYISAIEDMPSE